jgi:hypothetical protein
VVERRRRPVEDLRRFVLDAHEVWDGEPPPPHQYTIGELRRANPGRELVRVLALGIGESAHYGGGAEGEVTVTRVA